MQFSAAAHHDFTNKQNGGSSPLQTARAVSPNNQRRKMNEPPHTLYGKPSALAIEGRSFIRLMQGISS
jgi:hypothetical protein